MIQNAPEFKRNNYEKVSITHILSYGQISSKKKKEIALYRFQKEIHKLPQERSAKDLDYESHPNDYHQKLI